MRRAFGLFALGLAGAGLLAQSPPAPSPPVVRIVQPSKEAAAKIGPAPARTEGRRFDPNKVELSRQDKHWRLVHDGTVLKDFGPSEQDARAALGLIRKLHLDEVTRVGPEGAGMEYWLAGGKAPAAQMRGGMRTVTFDTAAMRVERLSGQWCVRDESRVYCAFGGREADARQALEVMRRHHFTQAGLLGHGAPVMTVFFGQDAPEVPVLKVPHASNGPGSSKTMDVQKFPRLVKNPDGSDKKMMPKATSLDASPALIPGPAGPAAVKDRRDTGWRAKKAEVAAGPDGRVVFDWRQVHLNQDGGACELAIGTRVLANFDGNSDAARTALSAVRYYRCTEQYSLSSDVAGKWFVVPQVAPRGVMFGMTADPVRPEKMQVVHDGGGRYALAEGERVVLPMAASAGDAARLLEMMQRLHIDRITRLGPPGPGGVAFLLRSR